MIHERAAGRIDMVQINMFGDSCHCSGVSSTVDVKAGAPIKDAVVSKHRGSFQRVGHTADTFNSEEEHWKSNYTFLPIPYHKAAINLVQA